VAAMRESKIMTEKNISYAFKTFDINGDGVIDLKEFRTVVPKNKPHKEFKNEMTDEIKQSI